MSILDALCVRIGLTVARIGIPLMILSAAAEPIARALGHGSELPFAELSTAAFLAFIMTAFGHAYAAGANLRLDVLSRRFPPLAVAALELAGSLLVVVPICAVVVLYGADAAWRSWLIGERWADGPWPLQWLVRAWVPIGFLLLLVAALASTAHSAIRLVRR